MARARFQLRPDETAAENLWRAVKMACIVVCSRYHWYGLVGDSRRELLEELELATYRHFINVKVMEHKYCRETKEGKPLTFFDNVIGSAWALSGSVLDRYMRNVVRMRANSVDIDSPIQPSVEDCRLSGSLTYEDKHLYRARVEHKPIPYSKQTPRQRANTIRAEYEEHVLDCQDMGISVMPWDKWLESTGYSEDEDAMWFLYSREEKKEIRRKKKAAARESRRVERQAEKMNRQLAKDRQHYLPRGWKFVERDGLLCITRDDDEASV